jgi:hypothetical protein
MKFPKPDAFREFPRISQARRVCKTIRYRDLLQNQEDGLCMTDATIYVSTQDIKAAVNGRETEILTAYGIDWRKGRPHIRCPYSHHDDRDPILAMG